jgi:hypothetical protein
MPGKLAAAASTARMTVSDPRLAVNLMLNAIEGIKLGAAFESQISDVDEQKALVQALFDILGVQRVHAPAAAPARLLVARHDRM